LDIPISRSWSRDGRAFVALCWTPDPWACSDKTLWRAVTESPPISRAEFDELRASFARA